MAPLKTKRLSSFLDHPLRKKISPVQKARRSSRMAAKRVFSTAKNRPHNSPSHPLVPDDSDNTAADPQPKNPPITPQEYNHTVPADPPSVGCDEVDEATGPRTRVRTFHGKRPIITKKRKFDSSVQQVEKPASACPQPNQTHPPLNSTPPENTSRPVPPPLRTSPRRAAQQSRVNNQTALQQSNNPVPAPQPSSSRVPTPQPSTSRVPTPQPSTSRVPTPQPSITRVPAPQPSITRVPAPQPSSTRVPAPQPSSTRIPATLPSSSPIPAPQQSSHLARGPPAPSLEEFSQQANVQVPEAFSQQENVQVPDKPKSIRVKFGDDIEEEKRTRRGLVNGLRLEVHCHTIGGKIKVEKDADSDTPANEKVRSLLTHDIGAYIKDRMPMFAATYVQLDKKYRDDMTNHLALHFELPQKETWLWDFIWRIAARRYSNWKCHCHKFYKEENGEVPAEFLWRTDQWAWLCEHFRDPKFIARSTHCANIRKNGKRLNHHLGKTTLKARAKKFALGNHSAPYIAAFEEAYSADPNGSLLVAQVKDKLQLLLDDRSVEDPGSVTEPVPEEDQQAIITEVLQAYKGTDAQPSRRTRNKVGPTVAELRAELERAKAEARAKEAEYKAREDESRAAFEDMQGRLKVIEEMMRAGFAATGLGVTAPSDGASFIPSHFHQL